MPYLWVRSFNVINTFVEKLVRIYCGTISAGREPQLYLLKDGQHRRGAAMRRVVGRWDKVGEAAGTGEGALSLSVFDCATAGPMSINGSTFYGS